jgi:hypothetical protein
MKLPEGHTLPIIIAWEKLNFFLLVVPLIILSACAPTHTFEANTMIPIQSDWVDCGPIFSAGAEGAWDYYLWGGFASTVVKKDGIFYLYYQGSDGYDDIEHTVTWRSIGVATSSDGFNFNKYEHNPILTWFPRNNLEEGAVSGGAFIDATGEIAIYYGANRWIGGSEVNADGRLAISTDGFNFTDMGVVLDHGNRAVWGWGDELFPVIGFHDNGRWFTYYIPNGVPQRGQLGVAWGNSRDQLTNSAAARSGASAISVWGPGSSVRIGPDVYAIFTNDVYGPNGPVLEVRTLSLNAPDRLSAPVQSYQFENVWEAIVYLDEDTDTWFMFYRSFDHAYYGVKIAAADGREISCPVEQASASLKETGCVLDDDVR